MSFFFKNLEFGFCEVEASSQAARLAQRQECCPTNSIPRDSGPVLFTLFYTLNSDPKQTQQLMWSSLNPRVNVCICLEVGHNLSSIFNPTLVRWYGSTTDWKNTGQLGSRCGHFTIYVIRWNILTGGVGASSSLTLCSGITGTQCCKEENCFLLHSQAHQLFMYFASRAIKGNCDSAFLCSLNLILVHQWQF